MGRAPRSRSQGRIVGPAVGSVVVLCICAWACRKQLGDQGNLVSVSARRSHRIKDKHLWERKLWGTAEEEALICDSYLRNFNKPFIFGPAPATRTISSEATQREAPRSEPSGAIPAMGTDARNVEESPLQLATGLLMSRPSESYPPTSRPGSSPLLTGPPEPTGALELPSTQQDSCGNGAVSTAASFTSDANISAAAAETSPDTALVLDDTTPAHSLQDEPPVSRPMRASFSDLLGEVDGINEDELASSSSSSAGAATGGLDEEVYYDNFEATNAAAADSAAPARSEVDQEEEALAVSASSGQYGVVPFLGFLNRIGPFTRKEAKFAAICRKEQDEAKSIALSLLPLGQENLLDLLEGRVPEIRVVHSDDAAPVPRVQVTKSNILTLKHLSAWEETGGNFDAYERHAAVLQDGAKTPILTLHQAHRLVEVASELVPVTVDMCPAACVAYTGPRATMDKCPTCNLGRYRDRVAGGRRVAVKTYQYLPYKPRLAAYYAHAHWSAQLQYGGRQMRKAKDAFAHGANGALGCDPAHVFGDAFDGVRSAHFLQEGRFKDSRDIAVAISTDGAQLLPHRRNSSAWLVLLQTLNLPPNARFRLHHQHVSLIVPGPGTPQDLDSFLWPLYAELASLSVYGTMAWDASARQWFRLHAHLVAVYADQPASAKMAHLVGGCGLFGCRCCTMQAVRPRGAGHAAYYPTTAMVVDTPLNAGRGSYNPRALPLRTPQQLVEAVANIKSAGSRTRRQAHVTSTGIDGLPAVSFSLAFRPFEFFPLDPFHLFHFNVPKTIWKALIQTLPGEFGLTEDQRSEFGAFIAVNAKKYPVSFSSRAPRDISLFANTSYKMVEWGSVFHHFLPAYLHAIGAPALVRVLIDVYVRAVDLAMTVAGLKMEQVKTVKSLFVRFVRLWERLYVATEDALPRATISIHLLLHVADQIVATGSIRATSQSACERFLGSLKRGLTAFRYPYAVLARRARSDTQLMLAKLRLGLEGIPDPEPGPRLSIQITKTHRPVVDDVVRQECSLLTDLYPDGGFQSQRYGRYSRDGLVVRAWRAEGPDSRSSSHVEFRAGDTLSFGKVLHFVAISRGSSVKAYATLMVFHVEDTTDTFSLGRWTSTVMLCAVEAIVAVVAALDMGASVYIARRSSWQTELDYAHNVYDSFD